MGERDGWGWGSLCFREGDGGTEGVRWLVVAVGGSLFLWISVFVSLTLYSVLVFYLFFGRKGLRRIYDDLEILEGEYYTTILRFEEVTLR